MKHTSHPAGNKAEKFNEEIRMKQKDHKDKEKRENVASLYKEGHIPRSRKSRQGK